MIPNTLEAWSWLLIACVVGFVMGQWMKARRKKADAGRDAASRIRKDLEYAARHAKKGKAKKRDRKINQKNGGR